MGKNAKEGSVYNGYCNSDIVKHFSVLSFETQKGPETLDINIKLCVCKLSTANMQCALFNQ